LPDEVICLLPDLNVIISVSSTALSCEVFHIIIDLSLGFLKLSLDECKEFIILDFITMVVQGLLFFYHLEKPGHLLLQQLQQQQ
jgi:hypothetical protein